MDPMLGPPRGEGDDKRLATQHLKTARPLQLGRVGMRAFSENSGEGGACRFPCLALTLAYA
jgi:hypothetical protein